MDNARYNFVFVEHVEQLSLFFPPWSIEHARRLLAQCVDGARGAGVARLHQSHFVALSLCGPSRFVARRVIV